MTADSPPQITTVLPTFRRPAYLQRALSSVLEQSFEGILATVYDNASGDSTCSVVARYQRLDPRVQYHCHEKNIGAAQNFEYGLQRIETPYFSILSDDDYLLPGFYAHAISELERNPAAMFWAGITLDVDESGTIWDARVSRWSKEGLIEPPGGALEMLGGLAPTWTGIVFRREVLARVGFPDKAVLGPSDLDFILRIAAAMPFFIRKIPVAVFTLNPSSFSATQPLSSFWPGWQKMLANIAAIPGVPDSDRALLSRQLHIDASRMLFRRGANALAQGRTDFARDAANALRTAYQARGKSSLLSVLASLFERVPTAGRAYGMAYRLTERSFVHSRRELQRGYGHLLRPVPPVQHP